MTIPELLTARFEAMADARETHAAGLRILNFNYAVIAGLESAATAYRRCADEVRRAANGETPPPPGEVWDEPPKNGEQS